MPAAQGLSQGYPKPIPSLSCAYPGAGVPLAGGYLPSIWPGAVTFGRWRQHGGGDASLVIPNGF